MIKKLVALLTNPKGILKSRALRFRRFLASHNIPQMPEPPVWQFPEGFTVHSVGDTGVRVVDNFLSPDEAAEIIATHGEAVKKSTVIGPDGKSISHDYRTSSDTFIPVDSDPVIRAVVYRAASLFGLPVDHVEIFSLTRYQHGEYYKSHYDHDGSLKADRIYTLLIYLNDLKLEDGGGTQFDELNLVAHPVCGRAVLWANSDSEQKVRPDSKHCALPITGENAEKWVAQLWFRTYRTNTRAKQAVFSDRPAGVPLQSSDSLPEGITLSSDSTQTAQ